MNHVTDERADRPLDQHLHDWLTSSVEDLPDGAELPSVIRSDVLSRLPGTPQRRRWWPLRRFPLGIDATRGTEPAEPHDEGRTRTMFSATQAVVATAVLALAGGAALLAVSGVDQDPVPGAEPQTIDPAAFGGFSGTVMCSQGWPGDVKEFEWGTLTTGETYPRCTVEASDPRISGANYSVHDYFRYDGEPQWGVRSVGNVITNEEGGWVSEHHWGYQHPEDQTMLYSATYRGTGAYEGLSALAVMSQDTWGFAFDIEGVIFPGDLPESPEAPIEAALAAD